MVRVGYSTEFGDYEKVISINEIADFSKDTLNNMKEIKN
jgi:hypothetical protein